WGQYGWVALPLTGTYTVRVRQWQSYSGEYRLRVSLARPPLQMETEDNNSVGQPNTPDFLLTNRQEVAMITGYISVGDGLGDYYLLKNRSYGAKITLGLRQPASSGLAGQMWIYQLTNGVTRGITNSAAGETNLVYDVPPGGDGAYYARVTAAGGAGLL